MQPENAPKSPRFRIVDLEERIAPSSCSIEIHRFDSQLDISHDLPQQVSESASNGAVIQCITPK